MAVVLASGGGRGRRGRRRGGASAGRMADINVTPMVDVMLVLLIVFMVTAPLLTVGVKIDMPKTQAGAIKDDKEPLALTIDQAGKVYIQNTEIGLDQLVPRMQAISNNGYDQPIFLRADRGVDYGKVAEVVGALSSAGFTKLVLVNDPAPKAPRGG